jgi:hypothetical protein
VTDVSNKTGSKIITFLLFIFCVLVGLICFGEKHHDSLSLIMTDSDVYDPKKLKEDMKNEELFSNLQLLTNTLQDLKILIEKSMAYSTHIIVKKSLNLF